MLRLSDDELDAVMTAAAPLDPADRDGFVRAVAAELASCPEIGPGAVHRAIVATQRRFWTPPQLSHEPGARSKWR
jgi:hypothetical protein